MVDLYFHMLRLLHLYYFENLRPSQGRPGVYRSLHAYAGAAIFGLHLIGTDEKRVLYGDNMRDGIMPHAQHELCKTRNL